MGRDKMGRYDGIDWSMVAGDRELSRMYRDIGNLRDMARKLGVSTPPLATKLKSIGEELKPSGFPNDWMMNKKALRLTWDEIEGIQSGQITFSFSRRHKNQIQICPNRFKRIKEGDVRPYDLINYEERRLEMAFKGEEPKKDTETWAAMDPKGRIMGPIGERKFVEDCLRVGHVRARGNGNLKDIYSKGYRIIKVRISVIEGV